MKKKNLFQALKHKGHIHYLEMTLRNFKDKEASV